MKQYWNCPVCRKPEQTGPHVHELSHIHKGKVYQLSAWKKEKKPAGEVTAKSLKADVWDLFSEWVRRSAADEDGYCACVTCGKIDIWKSMQAGHYISRKYSGTFIDKRNVHVQCPKCNLFLHGNLVAYEEFMLKTYGERVLAELEFLAKRRHKFTVFELTQYKKLYTQKLADMK
jgi:hypothetical protein